MQVPYSGKLHKVLISLFHNLGKFAKISIHNCTVYCSIMALLNYFSVKSKSLPDANGPLLSTMKPQAIESANRKVSALLASDSSTKDHSSSPSHGPYMKFSPEQKAQVARYTMGSGSKWVIVRYPKQWGVCKHCS